jgi:hypothetical protein
MGSDEKVKELPKLLAESRALALAKKKSPKKKK